MNINPIIESALASIGVPVASVVYRGTSKTYITYYTVLEKDSEYADDSPIYSESTGTIDIFSSGDFKALLESVKDRLKTAGFLIIGVGPETYESDTKLYHVPVDIYLGEADG